MSVPEGLRKESKLEVIVKARELAAYTIRITKNPKVFLPEYNTAITNDIISTAKNIFIDAWTANNIYVKEAKDWEERSRLQQKAALECNNLLALMQLAQEIFHLSTRRIKYWGSKTIEVRNKIRAWHDADRERYKLLL